jgi:hypothetical protein
VVVPPAIYGDQSICILLNDRCPLHSWTALHEKESVFAYSWNANVVVWY